ncbi:MAG: sugar phosphate isomerase/epimerase [Opitutaceae bacterium]|nr:sugar phosphate isomerase/epimerase [Opitutaceae bacterium]
MKLGLCTTPDVISKFSIPPCDFIEGHVQNLLLPEQPAEAFAPHAKATRGCVVPTPAANCLFPPDLRVTGPSVDRVRMARYAESAFSRAASIGLTTIVFGSGAARKVPDGWPLTRGFEQYVEALNLLAPIAQANGITLVVEALQRGECNIVNTLDDGAEAVRRCNHSNVRLLVDVFHMLRNGETPDAITRHAAMVTHAHIAENRERAEPGRYDEDFRPFLRALRTATACGLLTIECVWSQGDIIRQAPNAIAALRRQLSDAGF